MKLWLSKYKSRESGEPQNITKIDESRLDLVKYFITSNAALKETTNPHFLKLLNTNIRFESWRTFRYTVLNSVLDAMSQTI
jgi:hypothetical protein